jgi:hypothetical protein
MIPQESFSEQKPLRASKATSRIEELAVGDPTCGYFLYSIRAGRIIGR